MKLFKDYKIFRLRGLKKILTSVILSSSVILAADIVIKEPPQEEIDSCRTIEYNSMGCRGCDGLYNELVRFARISGFDNVQEYVESVLREEVEYQNEIEETDC